MPNFQKISVFTEFKKNTTNGFFESWAYWIYVITICPTFASGHINIIKYPYFAYVI